MLGSRWVKCCLHRCHQGSDLRSLWRWNTMQDWQEWAPRRGYEDQREDRGVSDDNRDIINGPGGGNSACRVRLLAAYHSPKIKKNHLIGFDNIPLHITIMGESSQADLFSAAKLALAGFPLANTVGENTPSCYQNMFNLRLCNAATIPYSLLEFGHMHLCGINYKYFSSHSCKCNSLGCTATIRYGSACHGPHSHGIYLGSEHNQFDSPRLVKREAGFPNPWRALIVSNQLWRANDSPYYREYLVLVILSHFNPLRPGDTIEWHRSGSTLTQVMACWPPGLLPDITKPLPEPMLAYHQRVQWHSYESNFPGGTLISIRKMSVKTIL